MTTILKREPSPSPNPNTNPNSESKSKSKQLKHSRADKLYIVYEQHGGDILIYGLDFDVCRGDFWISKIREFLELELKYEKYRHGMGFAALGSKIYMVSGQFYPDDEPSLKVYLYDTESRLFEKGPILNAPKYRPNVVVMQGKIYVFPTSFSPWKEHVSAPRFEVLNGESWSALPEPFDDDPEFCCVGKDDLFKVEAYVVHDDSKLILSTPKGICMFDVTEPHAGWKHVDGHLPFSKEGVLVDSDRGLCFGVPRDHPTDLLMNACVLSKDGGLANPINIAYDKYAKPCQEELLVVAKDYSLCLAPLVAGFRFGSKFSVYDYDIDDDDGNKICCVRSGCDSDCLVASILIDIFTIQELHWMREKEYRDPDFHRDVLILSKFRDCVLSLPEDHPHGKVLACFPILTTMKDA